MSRVAIITRHAVTNYGSLLQAYSTQKAIEHLGHDCEIIDYVREDEEYSRIEKTIVKGKANWSSNALKRAAYLMARQPEAIMAGRRFDDMRNKYLNLSCRYSNVEQMKKMNEFPDVFLTGSDQVWGPVASGSLDYAYMLSFVPDGIRKIAYASSFGRTDFGDEARSNIKRYLSRYDGIAVREDSAVSILQSMHLKTSQVLDPTLLFDGDWWRSAFPMKKSVTKHKKYYLVYQIHSNPVLGSYAKRAAKRAGMPLYRVSPLMHQTVREGKMIWCPPLETFLWLIDNAACVITDSFHGTAFSINLNTPFVEVVPDNGTGSRNQSLLRTLGLEDRMLADKNDLMMTQEQVDFEGVNNMLKSKRDFSLSVLSKMLAG